jgi:hypothetical protein
MDFSDPKLSGSSEVGWQASEGDNLVISGDTRVYFFDIRGKNSEKSALNHCLLLPPAPTSPEEASITSIGFDYLAKDLIISDDEGHLYLLDRKSIFQKATLKSLHSQVGLNSFFPKALHLSLWTVSILEHNGAKCAEKRVSKARANRYTPTLIILSQN